MKLTCDEATKICDKNQYGEAPFWDKIKLGLHLFLCKKCGLYSKQNSAMTKCYEYYKKTGEHHKDCLCQEEKSVMEIEIAKKNVTTKM